MTRKAKPLAAPNPSAEKSDKATEKPDLRTPEEKFGDSIRVSAGRETVEAFVVAFILALLFRAFVAEAFVIPTGSMAPTLMGAHKDIECQQCNHRFQIGASKERRGPLQTDTVIGGICPNCRFVNNLDLAETSEHATFNGDRILVSKFAYTISDPKRWDVIVFKFPGNPKQNYIKRLVGLPNETISIEHGDVFVEGDDAKRQILRKPPSKLLAMRHHVYDTAEQAKALVDAGYPSRLQPWRENTSEPPTDSWKVERGDDGFVASIESKDSANLEWLRYFHRWPSEKQWQSALAGQSLASVDPYSGRLITDYYGYDCYITVGSRNIFESAPSNARWAALPAFNPDYESGGPLSQFRGLHRYGERGMSNEGLHWVGDLISETEVETDEQCKQVVLELVEAGVQYQCTVDLTSGQAELRINDGGQPREFSSPSGQRSQSVTGETGLRAGDAFTVRFSNCDNELLLWINEELISFAGPTTFESREFRTRAESYPRYQSGVNPFDAAPFAIAVRGGAAKVHRVKIDRDKYYIATDESRFNGINDYDGSEYRHLIAQSEGEFEDIDIHSLMASPDRWKNHPMWLVRRKVSFRMEEDQFFPMGDNSPESLDARCWAGARRTERLPARFHDKAYAFADASYVPRDLLVGKALMVFWPHPWNSPVPFTPNFDRFRLIR